MTSNSNGAADPTTAFVWFWQPGSTEPVPVGRIDQDRDTIVFTYGRRYLDTPGAVPIYLPELPLVAGPQLPLSGAVAGCIRDAAPDGWGQRVIDNRLAYTSRSSSAPSLLTYLLESGSDRIGALDFQTSPDQYVPRDPSTATLAELMESADRVDAGIPLSPELDRALLHGTSIGGARPKAVLTDDGRALIAKFSSSTDTSPLVQFEFVGMELARRCGIATAGARLVTANGRQVLIVDRFDRAANGSRRAMVSALTILGLDENGGRYASYSDLADCVRARFTDPDATLRELFGRLTLNILIGNTDDHARNHAGFWNGTELTMTPAYDICPWLRSGDETSQAMAIDRAGRRDSRLDVCVDAASIFHLERSEARDVIEAQVATIESNWGDVCDLAHLDIVQRQRLRNGAVLHPSVFYGYGDS